MTGRPHPPALSRAGQAIIATLRAQTENDGWMRQGDMIAAAGVPASTLSRTKTVLADRGLIEEGDVEREGRGRPAKAWRLCRSRTLAGGILLDAFQLHAAVADMDGGVVSWWSGVPESTKSTTIPEDAARTMRRWAEEGLAPERFVSVTIAVPETVAEARTAELERALASRGVPGRVVPLGAAVADYLIELNAREPEDLVIGAWVGRQVDARVMRRGGPVAGTALDPLVGEPPDDVGHAFSLVDQGGLTPPVDPMEWGEAVFARKGYQEWTKKVGRWLARAGLEGAAPKVADAVWVCGPLPEPMLDHLVAAAEAGMKARPDGSATPRFRHLDPNGTCGLVAALAGLARLGARE